MTTNRDAIATLIFSYAEMLDRGDFAGVASLFSNATYGADGYPLLRGSAEVLAAMQASVTLYDGIPRTQHVTTNVMIDVDDDRGTAGARSCFTVFQAVESFPLQPVIAGRYHDRFERVDGAWRFTARLIFMDLIGDLSRHLGQRS